MNDTPPDPTGIDQPHDTLAAEEFAIPQPETRVPRDPDPRPHDVLAAEEFAMPAPEDRPGAAGRGGSLSGVALAALAGVALAALAALRGRGRRRRRR